MQVTVFGASGKVGQQVVALLQSEKHQVVAFVHRQNPYATLANIKTVSGDIGDPTAVARALAGSQAAIVTLGSWGSKQKNIVSTGTATIVAAMPAAGITRLITLTGASAWCAADNPNILDKITHRFLGLVAPKILADGEAHLQMLEATNLRWTCLRSPVMTGTGQTSYNLRSRLPSLLATIPRAAVAQAIIDQLTDETRYGQAPVLYRA